MEGGYVAKPLAADVTEWASELDAAAALLAPHFARSEPRRRAAGYIRGLLSDVERKNGWQLAEHLGDPTPDGVQHLLARAGWDADAVRDDLIGTSRSTSADPGGVLVVDETGFLKKGAKSVGVARQYSGHRRAGRELPGRGVPRVRRPPRAGRLLDRALYLPKEWAGDAGRRKAAGVPGEVEFATKPRLAQADGRPGGAAGVRRSG